MGAYEVRKEIIIAATLEEVKQTLIDFQGWKVWSPWLVLEPEAKVTYDGIAGNEGSSYSWESALIGSGRITLERILSNTLEYKLEFLKPWKSEAKAVYEMENIEHGTRVVWRMNAHMPWFMFFMQKRMKAWTGMDFERGLRMLKEYIQTGEVAAKTTYGGIVNRAGFSYVGIKNRCELVKLSEVMGESFKKLLEAYPCQEEQNVLTITTKVDIVDQMFELICAVTTNELLEAKAPFVTGSLPSLESLKVSHLGSYEHLGNAWSMAMMLQNAKKLKVYKGLLGYEVYLNSPHEVSPEKLQTEIYIPLR